MTHFHSPQNSLLGQSTDYPKTYNPSVLYPIARSLGRQQLSTDNFIGVDYWHIFELSWLNAKGIAKVGMARLVFCASSPYIIESKSLKLYLNSLNFTRFDTTEQLKQTIIQDLSTCLACQVNMDIFDVHQDSLPICLVAGECIDNALDNVGYTDTPDVSRALLNQPLNETIACQHFCSHLLRSNCPVTNQPDWGTVQIIIECGLIDTACLLSYILSYRNHNGFHEQCVEQIFDDLTLAYKPKSLIVQASYTRRGGIDINPVRVSDKALLPTFIRLNRQ